MSLNRKRKLFVEEYLECWNASEAARRAGYAHPGSQGHRLLQNVEIQAKIQERLDEKCMSADEVLLRLAAMARGDVEGFIDINEAGDWEIDWSKAEGKTQLIKTLREGKYGTTIELYDAQAALEKIGRAHGLFKTEVDVNLRVEEIDAAIESELAKLAAARQDAILEAPDGNSGSNGEGE